MAFTAHEEYFASVSPDARRFLESIQAKVEASVPVASRCIGYNMPAFKQARVLLLRCIQEAHRHLSARHPRRAAHPKAGAVPWREGKPVVSPR